MLQLLPFKYMQSYYHPQESGVKRQLLTLTCLLYAGFERNPTVVWPCGCLGFDKMTALGKPNANRGAQFGL
jgi:hypothetical protein